MFTESLIDSALLTGVIEILKDYLVKFCTDEDVTLMVLLAVGSLADSGNYLTCNCYTNTTAAVADAIFVCVVFFTRFVCTECTFYDSVYHKLFVVHAVRKYFCLFAEK